MVDKIYNNADSFATSFDLEWQKINCQDLEKKIDLVMKNLSEHPFVIYNRTNAINIAKFRIFSLKKFQ